MGAFVQLEELDGVPQLGQRRTPYVGPGASYCRNDRMMNWQAICLHLMTFDIKHTDGLSFDGTAG